jgi:hypothetical protein
MNDNPELVWAELEARAVRLLEHPKDLEPREPVRRYGSLLRLWHYPAYAPQRTWTLLTPGRTTSPDALPRVREVVWDRSADQQRVFNAPAAVEPHPSIRLRDATLPPAVLQHLLQEGTALAVPLLVFSKPAAMEGELFGLENYEVSPSVRVQWWAAGPVEWRHFIDWVAAVRDFVLRQLDS